jgi:ribose transport system substrate-binding protein
MGYEGIKTALAASNGEKVPENVDTGANVITKENMNTERSKELLTPDVTSNSWQNPDPSLNQTAQWQQ